MITNKIYCGDSLETIKTFPDESIDCCITSPPYWGLRDYQTAKWEGGDKNCDHQIPKNKKDPKNPNAESHISRFNREFCYKCGAKRIDSQLGMEKTPEEYVNNLVNVFKEVKRVLKKEGTCWLNLGDSYFNTQNSNRNGITKSLGGKVRGGGEYKTQKRQSEYLKHKDLVGIPWRVAFALQTNGWYLRQDIIWHKSNPMPESVKDRCTKSHEYVFLLTKSSRYYFDNEAIKEPTTSKIIESNKKKLSSYTNKPHKSAITPGQQPQGKALKRMAGQKDKEYKTRNKRDVWNINTKPFKEAHFATFPELLIEPMIKAGCPKNGIVIDPFIGAGTTAIVAIKFSRKYIGIDLNSEYIKIAKKRIKEVSNQLSLIK